MTKIELHSVSVAALIEMITSFQELLFPGEIHRISDLQDADYEMTTYHHEFFSRLLLFDDREKIEIARLLPRHLRQAVVHQLAICRLLAETARNKGWETLVIPTSIAVFFSIAPKVFLLKLNEERYAQGTASSQPGVLVLEDLPEKNAMH